MRSIEKLRKKSKSFPTQNDAAFENWDTFPIFNLEEAQKKVSLHFAWFEYLFLKVGKNVKKKVGQTYFHPTILMTALRMALRMAFDNPLNYRYFTFFRLPLSLIDLNLDVHVKTGIPHYQSTALFFIFLFFNIFFCVLFAFFRSFWCRLI